MDTETHVIVDSRDRDRPLATAPSSYTYTLDDPIRNVVSAQLVAATYNITPDSDTYVSLLVDELQPPGTWSKTPTLRESFAQIPWSAHHHHHHGHEAFRGPQSYPKPLAKVAKLTVRFARHDGSTFADMPEHLLVFKIVRHAPRLLTDDASLRALGLPPGYTLEELSASYVSSKAQKIRTGAHPSELVLLKAAYKDLYRRIAIAADGAGPASGTNQARH